MKAKIKVRMETRMGIISQWPRNSPLRKVKKKKKWERRIK
jgi:hypothetical protein